MSEFNNHTNKASTYSSSTSSLLPSTNPQGISQLLSIQTGQNHNVYINTGFNDHHNLYQQDYSHLVASAALTTPFAVLAKPTTQSSFSSHEHAFIHHHLNPTGANAYAVYGPNGSFAIPMHNLQEQPHSMNILDQNMIDAQRRNSIPQHLPMSSVHMSTMATMHNQTSPIPHISPEVIENWKNRFYKGDIHIAPPTEYDIVEKPAGPQFRSPLWTYGLLLRHRQSPELKWFCLADENCIHNCLFYTATRSNSKVVKHLTKYHKFQSSRSSDRPRGGKRKFISIYPSSDVTEKPLDNISTNDPMVQGVELPDRSDGISTESKDERNLREVSLRLVYQAIENMVNPHMFDASNSQSLYKIVLPSQSFNSSSYKNAIYDLYQYKSSVIRNEILAVQQKNPLPFLHLFFEIVSIPNDDQYSVFNLHVSYINIQGDSRSYILGSKMLASHSSILPTIDDILVRWIHLVLSEYECIFEFHVLSCSIFSPGAASEINLQNIVINKLKAELMPHFPNAIQAMLSDIFCNAENTILLDIRQTFDLIIKVTCGWYSLSTTDLSCLGN